MAPADQGGGTYLSSGQGMSSRNIWIREPMLKFEPLNVSRVPPEAGPTRGVTSVRWTACVGRLCLFWAKVHSGWLVVLLAHFQLLGWPNMVAASMETVQQVPFGLR